VQLGVADALRGELGRAARHTAEAIDWERVNERFAEALVRAWRGSREAPASAPARYAPEAGN